MSIANATTFWIEAGAMGTGGSRNILELPHNLTDFFGDQVRTDEVLTVQLTPGVQLIRPFIYRGDDYGHFTDRWRLCLPTARMGGPDYVDRVVRLDKLQIGGLTVFQLTVADRNSAQDTAWRQQSVPPNGETGTTFGGRTYGWWRSG